MPMVVKYQVITYGAILIPFANDDVMISSAIP